jgi:CBS domain containing-hemolysin-like protein
MDSVDVPAMLEKKKREVLLCLEAKLPGLYSQVDPDWDIETLRGFMFDAMDKSPETTDGALTCMNDGITPWQPLSRW